MSANELYWDCRDPGDPLWGELTADQQRQWDRAEGVCAGQYQIGRDEGYERGFGAGYDTARGSE